MLKFRDLKFEIIFNFLIYESNNAKFNEYN